MSRTSTTTSTEVPNLSKPKHDPKAYVALREQGFTNYQIADQPHVDEASVRRGLRKAGYKPYLLPAGVVKQLHVELEKPIRIDSKADGPGADVRYYLVAVLFILFDVEIIFFYPWAVTFRALGLFGFI